MHSDERFEKFTNRKKNKPSGFSKKQQQRAKRGSRHGAKQDLNDSVFRKDNTKDINDNCD